MSTLRQPGRKKAMKEKKGKEALRSYSETDSSYKTIQQLL
jgi:hypothetical protein